MNETLEQLHILFHGVPGSEAQQQASRWLIDFEQSAESLTVAVNILKTWQTREPSSPITAEGYFVACQILISKIKFQWMTINSSDWEYVAHFLVGLHQLMVHEFVGNNGNWQVASDEQLYVRVCLAIVGIAFRNPEYGKDMIWTAIGQGTNEPGFFIDRATRGQSSGGKSTTQRLEMASLPLLFKLLNTIAEEFEPFWHEITASHPCASHAATIMFQVSPLVLEYTRHLFCCQVLTVHNASSSPKKQGAVVNEPSLDKLQQSCLTGVHCLCSWVACSVQIPYITMSSDPFLSNIMNQISSDDRSNGSISVSISLLNLSESPKNCTTCSEPVSSSLLQVLCTICRHSWSTEADIGEKITSVFLEAVQSSPFSVTGDAAKEWDAISPLLGALCGIGQELVLPLVSQVEDLLQYQSGLAPRPGQLEDTVLAWRCLGELTAEIGTKTLPVVRRCFHCCSSAETTRVNGLLEMVFWFQISGLACYYDAGIVETALEFWDILSDVFQVVPTSMPGSRLLTADALFVQKLFERLVEALLAAAQVQTREVAPEAPPLVRTLEEHYACQEPVLFHRIRAAAFDTMAAICSSWPHEREEFHRALAGGGDVSCVGHNAATVLRLLARKIVALDPQEWQTCDSVLLMLSAVAQGAQSCLSDLGSESEEEAYTHVGGVLAPVTGDHVPLASVTRGGIRRAELLANTDLNPFRCGNLPRQQELLQLLDSATCVGLVWYHAVVHLAETAAAQPGLVLVGACQFLSEVSHWMLPRPLGSGPIECDPEIVYAPIQPNAAVSPLYRMPVSLALFLGAVDYLLRCAMEIDSVLAHTASKTVRQLCYMVYNDHVAISMAGVPVLGNPGLGFAIDCVLERCQTRMRESGTVQKVSKTYMNLLKCRTRVIAIDAHVKRVTQHQMGEKPNEQLSRIVSPLLDALPHVVAAGVIETISVVVQLLCSTLEGFADTSVKVLKSCQSFLKPTVVAIWTQVRDTVVVPFQNAKGSGSSAFTPLEEANLAESLATCYQLCLCSTWDLSMEFERNALGFMVYCFQEFLSPHFLDTMLLCLSFGANSSHSRANRSSKKVSLLHDKVGELISSISSIAVWSSATWENNISAQVICLQPDSSPLPLVSHTALANSGVGNGLFKLLRCALRDHPQAFLIRCQGFHLLELHVYTTCMSIVEQITGGGDCYRYAVLLLCDLVQVAKGSWVPEGYVVVLQRCIPTLVCFVVVALGRLRRVGLAKRVTDILFALLNSVQELLSQSLHLLNTIFVSNTCPIDARFMGVHPELSGACHQLLDQLSEPSRRAISEAIVVTATGRKQRFGALVSDLSLLLRGSMSEEVMIHQIANRRR